MGAVIKYQISYVFSTCSYKVLDTWSETRLIGWWCSMCCMFIHNVQPHIDSAVLKAARKEILVFHIHEQLRLRRACTCETKTSGLVSIQTIWLFNVVIVERLL